MTYRPYYLYHEAAGVLPPPPPEQQIDDYGYQQFNPGIDCIWQREEELPDTIPGVDRWTRQEFERDRIWHQGRNMTSNDATARWMAAAFTCTVHGGHPQVFRQHAAYERRTQGLIAEGYRTARFGTDEAPWPPNVPEYRRSGWRQCYFLARPRARSTGSLWN